MPARPGHSYTHGPLPALSPVSDNYPSDKTQCQAFDRTQPSLPMRPGRGATMTHDDKRQGTIDLFAAMNVGTGQVRTHLRKSHAGADVLAFFKQIDATVPRGLSVHVILDNLSAHNTPGVRTWLAHKDRRRWHLHFTPTSSSWLNIVERWFKELTDKRLRRGVFTSVDQLSTAITTWAEHWNDDPKPFVWKATADDIIEKVSRGRTTLHQIKSPTNHYQAMVQPARSAPRVRGLPWSTTSAHRPDGRYMPAGHRAAW